MYPNATLSTVPKDPSVRVTQNLASSSSMERILKMKSGAIPWGSKHEPLDPPLRTETHRGGETLSGI